MAAGFELDQETSRYGPAEGKVAVITGANSGVGLAAAKRFARESAVLFLASGDSFVTESEIFVDGGAARI
jgi:hypothetical protein